MNFNILDDGTASPSRVLRLDLNLYSTAGIADSEPFTILDFEALPEVADAIASMYDALPRRPRRRWSRERQRPFTASARAPGPDAISPATEPSTARISILLGNWSSRLIPMNHRGGPVCRVPPLTGFVFSHMFPYSLEWKEN